jgi:hypothetical protein
VSALPSAAHHAVMKDGAIALRQYDAPTRSGFSPDMSGAINGACPSPGFAVKATRPFGRSGVHFLASPAQVACGPCHSPFPMPMVSCPLQSKFDLSLARNLQTVLVCSSTGSWGVELFSGLRPRRSGGSKKRHSCNFERPAHTSSLQLPLPGES